MSETIDSILEERRKAEAVAVDDPPRFYSVLRAEGLNECFIELRFRNGVVSLFNYSDLKWASYDPRNKCIDMDFDGFLITIFGRGIAPELFQGIKSKRVSWIGEADTEMQDNEKLPCFIQEITVSPPSWISSSESS